MDGVLLLPRGRQRAGLTTGCWTAAAPPPGRACFWDGFPGHVWKDRAVRGERGAPVGRVGRRSYGLEVAVRQHHGPGLAGPLAGALALGAQLHSAPRWSGQRRALPAGALQVAHPSADLRSAVTKATNERRAGRRPGEGGVEPPEVRGHQSTQFSSYEEEEESLTHLHLFIYPQRGVPPPVPREDSRTLKQEVAAWRLPAKDAVLRALTHSRLPPLLRWSQKQQQQP